MAGVGRGGRGYGLGGDIKEAGLTGHMEDEGQQYSQASGLSDWFYAADLPWGGSTWGGAGFEPRYGVLFSTHRVWGDSGPSR